MLFGFKNQNMHPLQIPLPLDFLPPCGYEQAVQHPPCQSSIKKNFLRRHARRAAKREKLARAPS